VERSAGANGSCKSHGRDESLVGERERDASTATSILFLVLVVKCHHVASEKNSVYFCISIFKSKTCNLTIVINITVDIFELHD
jgi:hypothetical protein